MNKSDYLITLLILTSFAPLFAQKQGKDIIEKKPMYNSAVPNLRIIKDNEGVRHEILEERSQVTSIVNTDGFSTDQNKIWWTSKGYYKIKDQSKLMPTYQVFNQAEKLITKENTLYSSFKKDQFNQSLLDERITNAREAFSLFEQAYKLAQTNKRKDVCVAALSNMAYLSYVLGDSESWKKSMNYLSRDEVASVDYGGTNAKFYAKHDALGLIGLRGNGWLMKGTKEGLGLCESKKYVSKVYPTRTGPDSLKSFDHLELSLSVQNDIAKVSEKVIDQEQSNELIQVYLPAQFDVTSTLKLHFKNTSSRIISLDKFVILMKVGDKQVHTNDKLVIERLMPGTTYNHEIKLKTNYFIGPGDFSVEILDLPVAFDEHMGHVIKKDNVAFTLHVYEKVMLEEWYTWMGNIADTQNAIAESGVALQ